MLSLKTILAEPRQEKQIDLEIIVWAFHAEEPDLRGSSGSNKLGIQVKGFGHERGKVKPFSCPTFEVLSLFPHGSSLF